MDVRHWASRLCRRRPETPVQRRARETFELHDLGVAAYRQRMRRENPQATEAEVDAMVRAWLHAPPRGPFLTPLPKDDDDCR